MAIETNTTIVSECPRFSAEIFIFLPSSWYGVMFWDVNNADKTLFFFFFYCLHRTKDFSPSCTSLAVRKPGVHKKIGGDGTRTDDTNWPRGYSMPYVVMLNHKTRGVGWDVVGNHCSVVDMGQQVIRNYTVRHLVCIFLCHNYYHYFPFPFCPIKLSLTQSTIFIYLFIRLFVCSPPFFSPFLSPSPPG